MQEFFKPSKGKSERLKLGKSAPKGSKPVLVKATFYLAKKHILALEELRLKLMKRKGRRVDKVGAGTRGH